MKENGRAEGTKKGLSTIAAFKIICKMFILYIGTNELDIWKRVSKRHEKGREKEHTVYENDTG